MKEELDIEKQKAELQVKEAEYKAFTFFKGFNRALLYWTLVFLALSIPIFFLAKNSVAALYMHNFYKRETVAHPASTENSDLPVQVAKSEILPLSSGKYSAYAILDNPYSKLSADNIHYSFHFLDASGNNMDTESGLTFLSAGQRNKLVIIPDVPLNSPPASLKVEIARPEWQYKIDVPDVVLRVSNPQYADQQNPPGFSATGTVQNATSYRLGSVVVKAAAYDGSGRIIAVTQSVLGKMSPHQELSYKLYWPLFLQAKTAKLRVSAETDVFDPQNIH